jgi:hypothetical protein
LSKSVTQSEEKIKQMIIDSLKGIEWDIMLGKTDAVMTKLEEAQKLTREWRARKT